MEERTESRQALADRIRREHLQGAGRSGTGLKLFVVVLALAACAGLLWFQFASNGADEEEIAVPGHSTEDYGFLLTPENGADGLIPVIIYEDFLCSSCHVFHEESGEFLTSQVTEGVISIEYRPFSFLTEASPDEYSQRAANAAVCVADLAGVPAFVTMHDLLLANQPEHDAPGPDDEQLIEFARTAGAEDAASCITERTFDAWVARALDAAIAADVSSTPTVRVDGETILRSTNGEEFMPGPDELRFAIERASE